jgi:hypothetical protein
MFDRSEKGFLDAVKYSESELLRFNNDPYLTRYLYPCFNPEFSLNVKIKYLKNEPGLCANEVFANFRKKRDAIEDVF